MGAILTQHTAWTTVERAHLPADPGLFNEYHALLVAVGKRHCRPVPRCRGCPLRFDLHGRPPRAT